MKKNSNNKGNTAFKIIAIVALIGFIVCVGIIIAYYKSLNSSASKFEELAETKNEAVEAASETVESSETTETTVEEYVSPIDFENLKATENEDIYAWIQVDGTTIDYPVLQNLFDDTYYLTHNLDGSYGYPGCIYTENYNTVGFTDPVTVVYGHYMKDGSMFASLHKFMDEDFFNENDSIVIYLPEEEKHYTIIGAYYTDDKRITVWYNFEEEEGIQTWLDDFNAVEENETNHKRNIEVSTSDHFIVLQTCVDADENGRYAVVAVEDKDE